MKFHWKAGPTPRLLWLALVGTGVLSTLAACGGGLQDDSNPPVDRLICATSCKSSSALATTDMRPSFAVVSDGAQVQAQAGFSSGSDLRFNVEIDGSDQLVLATPQGTQPFHIPGGNLGTIIIDAFTVLITGAKPYLSEATLSGGAQAMQFQFVRGATVLTSSVVLPAPYQITSPANGATIPVTARSLSVALTTTDAVNTHTGNFNCTDVNGNTASMLSPMAVVPGSLVSNGSGVSYTLDIGAAIDQLVFTTTFPRGSVARCDVTLSLIVQAQGQADARFSTTQVFAQQIRTAAIAMR